MSSFKKAERENIPLLIAVEGASGSGKTKSGLELLTGIGEAIAAREGRPARLGVIDTENKRALHYADEYDFLHVDMHPPFSPLAFGDLIDEAERSGIDALMIDSFSHEWSGEGGVKEWADRLEAGVPKPGVANPEAWKRDDWITRPVSSPGNWSDPKSNIKPGHKWLVAKMLRSPMHIILCLRSAEKLEMKQVPVLDRNGEPQFYNGKPKMKSEVIAAGDRPLLDRWVPDCEKALPYEITTSFLFVPSQPGVPIPRKLQDQHRPLVDLERRIDRSIGKLLAAWADGAKTPGQPTVDEARAALQGAGSLDDLRVIWRRFNKAPFWSELEDEFDSLKDGFSTTKATPEPQGEHGYDGA